MTSAALDGRHSKQLSLDVARNGRPAYSASKNFLHVSTGNRSCAIALPRALSASRCQRRHSIHSLTRLSKKALNDVGVLNTWHNHVAAPILHPNIDQTSLHDSRLDLVTAGSANCAPHQVGFLLKLCPLVPIGPRLFEALRSPRT